MITANFQEEGNSEDRKMRLRSEVK